MTDLKLPAVLSGVLGALVAVCALPPLLIRNFYRLADPVLLPGSYGQDIVSLAALPALWWAVRRASRDGSLRGVTVWSGLLLYYGYGYLLYAFGPQYTPVYPLYVAIAGLSIYSLLLLALRQDLALFDGQLRGRFPTLPAILLFAGTVLFLTPAWLAMMIEAIRQGRPSPFTGVHVLDLAFVFPALAATAVALWKRRPWGYAAAGPLLVKMAVLMSSLVIAELIGAIIAAPDPLPLVLVFTLLAVSSMLLTGRYLAILR